MLSVGRCGVARLQMKVGLMDGMHCFIDSTSILVKIKSVSLYNYRTVYIVETAGTKTNAVFWDMENDKPSKPLLYQFHLIVASSVMKLITYYTNRVNLRSDLSCSKHNALSLKQPVRIYCT